MDNQTLVIILIVAVVVVVVLVVAWLLLRGRGQRAGFEPRPLPAENVEALERRIDETERLFVQQPREAVAAARALVDEMLTQMGYPIRLTASERARDVAHFNRAHADRYRSAGELKDDASTEEMRRALQGYLQTAHDILGDARGRAGSARLAAADRASAIEQGPVTEERRTVVEDSPAPGERRVAEERQVVEERPAVDDRPAAPGERPTGG